jgi:hypothetical protein
MAVTVPMHGGCNCGEIRYRVTRAPLTAYICHCHLCQKRTGSAFSMQIVIPAEGFELLAGTPIQKERILPGGKRNVSLVCPSCYSRISTQREDFPTISIRAGTLDDTGWIKPVAQIWISSAQPWAIVPDILSYEAQPADFTELLAAWKAVEDHQ